MTDGKAPKVKLLAAILCSREAPFEQCLAMLEQRFSEIDYRGGAHPFTQTNYYQPEMGPGLTRSLVSFARLMDPGALTEAKHAAHEIEQSLSLGGKRRVNVDVGYLDLFKLVLASFKERGNKLYLGDGVWADMTLVYEKGEFQPLPWSFPDFAEGTYNAELKRIRDILKSQHKAHGGCAKL